MKVQTFLALGGPLNGHMITEQYAGVDYVRYNKAYARRFKFTQPCRLLPKCVLVYFPKDV